MVWLYFYYFFLQCVHNLSEQHGDVGKCFHCHVLLLAEQRCYGVVWVGYEAGMPRALHRSLDLHVNVALCVSVEHQMCYLFHHEMLPPAFRIMSCCALLGLRCVAYV